jgi:hypothetical protein
MTDQKIATSGEGRAVCPPARAGMATASTIVSYDESAGRKPLDDLRVAVHEGSHCLSGLVLLGADSLGGATICPSATYGGRTWGKLNNSAELGSTSAEDVPVDLCDRLRMFMPASGEPISDASEIHAHVRGRVVDLLSGSEGERLLCADGPPWHAESDLAQARRLAGIICCSAETVELFLAFCRAEASNLVAKHCTSIQAVAAALIEHRTLTGGQIVAVVAKSIAHEAMIAKQQRRLDWQRRCESAARFAPDQSQEACAISKQETGGWYAR